MNNLPKIALGAWSWGSGAVGGDEVFGNHLDKVSLKPVFDAAKNNNLKLWDTAYVYGMGASENILGSFIKEENRKDYIISTKFTPQVEDGTADAVQNMLNGSKERLHTDYIDIYWIHNPMDVEKWTPFLIPLAKTGQIKYIGVSNHNLKEIRRANEILNSAGLKISAIQNHYSLLHTSSEDSGILDYCNENNIVFFSYMILEQGALTGKYDTKHPFPKDSDRGNYYNKSLTKLESLIEEMKTIGKKYNASPAQIAIAWAICKGTLPIIGVTSAEQVEEAANASKIILTKEEINTLQELGKKSGVSTLRNWEKEM